MTRQKKQRCMDGREATKESDIRAALATSPSNHLYPKRPLGHTPGYVPVVMVLAKPCHVSSGQTAPGREMSGTANEFADVDSSTWGCCVAGTVSQLVARGQGYAWQDRGLEPGKCCIFDPSGAPENWGASTQNCPRSVIRREKDQYFACNSIKMHASPFSQRQLVSYPPSKSV